MKKYKINNKKKAPTLENFINKYGEVEGIKNFNKFLDENSTAYSKISQKLFWSIYDELKNKDHIYFSELNKEFRKINSNGNVYYFDFTDTINKKIIEFNGDAWHANPCMYKPTDNPHPIYKEIMSKEIWKKDNEKIEFIKKIEYDVLIVWESEYINNKQEILNQCLEFLNRKDE